LSENAQCMSSDVCCPLWKWEGCYKIGVIHFKSKKPLMKKNRKKTPQFKKPFLVLSRGRIFGWVVVIFFVCAWMFVLGVLVGRDTSPVKFDIRKLQQKLEGYIGENQEDEQSGTKKESVVVKDRTKLEFYEALPGNRSDTHIPGNPPPDLVRQKIEPATRNNASEPRNKSEAEQARSETGPSVDASQPEKAAPQSKTGTTDVTYMIQIAAFRNTKDADNLIAKLKARGYTSYRAIGKIPGKGIWYRVRMGDYTNKAEAQSTMEKLKKFGLKPILVQK
jgi:cell division septation protein DedD